MPSANSKSRRRRACRRRSRNRSDARRSCAIASSGAMASTWIRTKTTSRMICRKHSSARELRAFDIEGHAMSGVKHVLNQRSSDELYR